MTSTDIGTMRDAVHAALTLTPEVRRRISQEPDQDIRSSLRLAAQIDAVLSIMVEEVQSAVEEYKGRQVQIHIDPVPPQIVPVRAQCPRCGHR